MKKVIYTCIVGGYDELRQPIAVDPSFDYICFSNDYDQERIGVWRIRPIPVGSGDVTRISRFVKMMPHKALKDYDVSVWIDANITIVGKGFYDAVDSKVASGCLVAQVPHMTRDCVYEELAKCYMDLRIGLYDALRQRRHLIAEGFPRHFGLFENNLIFRRHNDPFVVGVSECWWEEYLKYSRRDQLALMPVYWRVGFKPEFLLGPGENTRNSDSLEIVRHAKVPLGSDLNGPRRLPFKIKWTWRRLVANLFLR